eukprot:TRINITY_DN256_c2_g1_i1.p1 TRINITY_DN256_c2_g1~~TRINITY_DN256_c2_g1_i1.p1  ORF type:complete len:156 (+),score=29.69 TRINITY_DN256_c2_g1_i1:81-548(+)
MLPLVIAGGVSGLAGLFCLYKAVKGGGADTMKKRMLQSLPQKGDAGYKEITLEDLRKHDFPKKPEELKEGKRYWMCLYGIIIDVTDYLPEHPGGFDVISDQSEYLDEWVEANDGTPVPDAAPEFDLYHTFAEVPMAAGLTGTPGKMCKYVGHLKL